MNLYGPLGGLVSALTPVLVRLGFTVSVTRNTREVPCPVALCAWTHRMPDGDPIIRVWR